MPFRVSEQGDAEHKTVLLEDTATGTKAEVYAFGALLNLFSVKYNDAELNIIDGFENTEDAIKNVTAAFQSTKLSPYVCRLREGRYTFANNEFKVEKYYTHREALHGLVYDAVFSVVETGVNEESAFVLLAYEYTKEDPGYPFLYRLQILYRLGNSNELSITTTATNLSDVSVPMSDGWHPYFTLGKPVDDLELFMNTEEMIEFDNRLLPTGNVLPFHQYQNPQKINDAQLDNCFVLRKNESNIAACILRDPASGLQLSIHPDAGYPYLQVFIPPHWYSIAIENLSSLPDAFNNGFGLIILEPSASAKFTTRFVVATNQF